MNNDHDANGAPVLFFRKESKMNKFWDLWERSLIIRGLVTLMLIGTSCALALMGRAVPAWLYGFAGMAIGSLFTGPVQQATRRQK